MAATDSTTLSVAPREISNSRAVRRLRREGHVPGVVYGGGEDPVSFQINARTLRNTLAHAGAVIDLSIDGQRGTPVMVKEIVRHPVNGETMHIDLLRVRMDTAIQSIVILELEGVDEAPGVIQGGVLEHTLREITIEALPGDVPDTLTHDASTMEVAATLTLGELKAPKGVTIVGDPESVVATITAPRLSVETDEIEEETAVVGEDDAAEGDSEEAGDAAESGDDADASSDE